MWDYRRSSILNVIYPGCLLPRSSELVPLPPAPVHPCLFPGACTAALPLCRSTELPGTACSSPWAPASKGYSHLPAGEIPHMKGNRAINQTHKKWWQPQAFGCFHRESGKTEKNMFFSSLSRVLTNNFLSQQSWAVRAVPTIFPNKWCVILPCLYLTSEKSAPLTQGYSLEIFRLDYSIYVIYFGSLIPISEININLNHKAFSPAPFMQIRHTAFPLLVLLTN